MPMSRPTSRASNTRPSASATMMVVASATTWLLVTIRPRPASTITPEPPALNGSRGALGGDGALAPLAAGRPDLDRPVALAGDAHADHGRDHLLQHRSQRELHVRGAHLGARDVAQALPHAASASAEPARRRAGCFMATPSPPVIPDERSSQGESADPGPREVRTLPRSRIGAPLAVGSHRSVRDDGCYPWMTGGRTTGAPGTAARTGSGPICRRAASRPGTRWWSGCRPAGAIIDGPATPRLASSSKKPLASNPSGTETPSSRSLSKKASASSGCWSLTPSQAQLLEEPLGVEALAHAHAVEPQLLEERLGVERLRRVSAGCPVPAGPGRPAAQPARAPTPTRHTQSQFAS